MSFTPDNNLMLGLSQALQNLESAGVRFAPRGFAEPVAQWVSSQGTSLNYAVAGTDAVENDKPLQTEVPRIADTATSSPIVEQLPLQPVAKIDDYQWQTKRLELNDRLKVLEQEANDVASCTRCTQLVCSRSRTVYGVGRVDSRIVFVGEGPGAEEDRQGIPFVGAAGQLLDKIILAMKLRREDVYIMNAVKCRPQNNRTPTDTEIANCQSYFLKQLEILQPEFIVCLGAVASRAVLQTTLGIGRLRGKLHAFRGAKVAVTYHPAYLLRTPEAKKLTWDDMKMVMAAMKLDK